MEHIFNFPEFIKKPGQPELFETLCGGSGKFKVERIVSWGHVTAAGEWYDQENDEWAMVLEGEAVIGFSDGTETRLRRGESIVLPRFRRHRVLYTSRPCIWLAVHAAVLEPAEQESGS
ncbi:MAG: cupin domain-containing protein [Deltaproteobacteria bacterium]|jgi:cupin 2 domain-containing protein|nr:cupin domain-containing protein [Deltaproteobacteria bacterium]